MKILFVSHTASLTGAPISSFNLMMNLGDDFKSVFVSKENGPLLDTLNRLGIVTYTVPKKGFQGLRYILSFIKILKNEHIDLVHLNTLTSFCKYAGISAKLMGIPIVWVVRENPLISRSRRLRLWLKLLSSKIIFVDKDTRDKLLQGSCDSRVEVVYNGVDLEKFKPFKSNYLYEKYGIDIKKVLIGYIGSITPRKGLEYLIRSVPLIAREYTDFGLIIIGGNRAKDESYANRVKESAKGMDILFTGALTDVVDVINSLYVVVLPSLEERCSRTLIESLACQKAVVATNVGGTPEIVDHGTNGFLVEPKDEKQMSCSILKLLRDKELAEKMGTSGRRKAENLFDIRTNVATMKRIYRDLVDECR